MTNAYLFSGDGFKCVSLQLYPSLLLSKCKWLEMNTDRTEMQFLPLACCAEEFFSIGFSKSFKLSNINKEILCPQVHVSLTVQCLVFCFWINNFITHTCPFGSRKHTSGAFHSGSHLRWCGCEVGCERGHGYKQTRPLQEGWAVNITTFKVSTVK